MAQWNLWHGCHKFSSGCRNCYVYRADARYERRSDVVTKTMAFDLPVKRRRSGEYVIAPGELVWTCFTSDFLVEDADEWRASAWEMMHERKDLTFFFITKRIYRFMECIPPDWGNGYENVHICCTMENQSVADERLPILKSVPAHKKSIACEPLLTPIDFRGMLGGGWLSGLVAGGESGDAARPCDFDWIKQIRTQCIDAGVPFHFKQTGYRFIKDGRLYFVPRPLQHAQASKANINWNYSDLRSKL